MAFSYVEKKKGVIGDLKYLIVEATFAAVIEGHIPTGLSNVVFAVANNEVSEDGLLEKNMGSDGSTASYGGVYLSGFTASDVATVFIVGY
jgi:hypothetical protein